MLTVALFYGMFKSNFLAVFLFFPAPNERLVSGIPKSNRFAGIPKSNRFAGIPKSNRFAGIPKSNRFLGICKLNRLAGPEGIPKSNFFATLFGLGGIPMKYRLTLFSAIFL